MESDTPRRVAKLPGFAVLPPIARQAPHDARITEYDTAHFLDYARLLDAERAGEDWHDAARAILRLDPSSDETGTRSCWESHLARAHWVATEGYALLLADAGLAPSPKPAPADE